MNLKSIFRTTLLFAVIAFSSLKASATKDTIRVVNIQFQPATLNVIIGDTIIWVWGAGSHTTTATGIPASATPWDADITTGSQTFEYVPQVAGIYNYECTPHAAFGMIASFTVSAPLPVKLSEFKVSNENNNAILRWTTQLEDNIDYFSVQKSKTGTDFVEIARVAATGHSSTVRTYSYTDLSASSSDKYGYYTIAVVDKEGRKELSPVALFKSKLTISKIILSLSPNPVNKSGHLMLKFNADKTSKMDVKVFNMQGKTVMETTMQAFEGVNNGHLMLDNMPAGSYSLSFELNGVKEVHKLIVR